MMKKIIASVLALATLLPSGAFCVAKDVGEEIPIIISSEQEVLKGDGLVEVDLGQLDITEEEKQELQENLQKLSTASDGTQKEKPRTKIKNWFKKHWKKVVGVSVPVVCIALLFICRVVYVQGHIKGYNDAYSSMDSDCIGWVYTGNHGWTTDRKWKPGDMR